MRRKILRGAAVSPEEVVDLYADLDPLSRAHQQAQDKRVAGEKFGDIPQLYVRV
jgi:hypothetical protein